MTTSTCSEPKTIITNSTSRPVHLYLLDAVYKFRPGEVVPVRIVVQAFNEQFPPDRNVWPQHPSMHRLYVPRPDGSVCYCGECLDMSSFAEVVEYAIATALFAQSMRAPYYIAFLDAHPSNKDMGLIIDQWRASFNDKPTPSSEPCQPTTPSEELRAPAPPTEVAPAVASTGAKPVRVYLMSAMCTFKSNEVITDEGAMMQAFDKQFPANMNMWHQHPHRHLLYGPGLDENVSCSFACVGATSYAEVVTRAISLATRSCPKRAPYGIAFIDADQTSLYTKVTVDKWRASFDDKYIPVSEEESRSSATPMVVAAPTPSAEVTASTVAPTKVTPLVVDPNNKRVRVYRMGAMCEFESDEVVMDEKTMMQAYAKQLPRGFEPWLRKPKLYRLYTFGPGETESGIRHCTAATSYADVVNDAILFGTHACPKRAPYGIVFISTEATDMQAKAIVDQWRSSFDDKYIPRPKPCSCPTPATPATQDPIMQWREASRAGELADEEMAKRYRLALAEKVNDPAYFIKAPPSWCVDEEDHSVFLAHVKRLRKLNANVLMSGHPARFAALESIGIHFGPVEEHNVFDLYSMCDSCTTGASKVTRRILLPWVSDEQKKE